MALMLHILPDEASSAPVDSRQQSFREGLGRALAVVEEIGGESSGPPRITVSELRGPPRPEMDAFLEELAMKITAASAAGLEAIAALGDEGLEANPAAVRLLADQLRDGLDALDR